MNCSYLAINAVCQGDEPMNRTRILIVDDEPSILRYIGAGLRAEGYEVTEAVDGEVAVWAVEVSSPNLGL